MRRAKRKRRDTLASGCCHVRCRSCQKRRTLPRPLALYQADDLPTCCGARRWRADTYRQRHEVGAGAPRPCTCPQYHFPHFRGRGLCIHNHRVTEVYEAERRGLPAPKPIEDQPCPF